MVIMLKDKQLRLYTGFNKISVFQASFASFLGQNWVKNGQNAQVIP